MKVLHVLYSGLGGHGNVFYSMVDADSQKINEYEAVFFGIEPVRDSYIQKAVDKKIKWHYVAKKPGFDFNSYQQIQTIIRESEPDIIFIHSSAYIFPALRAARTLRKKAKIIVRETQPNHLKTKLEIIGLCVSLLFAHKVVFLSKEFREEVKKSFKLFYTDKRTEVIPNGVDLDVYKPMQKTPDQYIRIGMQSRLSVSKDHKTLINAFSLLLKNQKYSETLRLRIAGDGTCRTDLEQQANTLNISDKIEFTGMLDEDKLPAFINSLDIYVHATLGEMMSTSIIQVMGCRVPVIASDVHGVNNMVKHEHNGLLVPAKDSQSLCNSIDRLISNPQEASGFAENAYDFALDNYSNKRMLNSYIKIFNS